MIKRILWLTLAGASAATDHAPPPDEVAYDSEVASFRARLKGDQFTFSDGRGAQTLTIKACNEKIIRHFYGELVEHAQMLAHDKARAAESPKGASLKIEGVEFAVGRYDSLYYYFNRTAKDSVVVLIQSLSACHEKL